jgi:hypothetical protein
MWTLDSDSDTSHRHIRLIHSYIAAHHRPFLDYDEAAAAAAAVGVDTNVVVFGVLIFDSCNDRDCFAGDGTTNDNEDDGVSNAAADGDGGGTSHWCAHTAESRVAF